MVLQADFHRALQVLTHLTSINEETNSLFQHEEPIPPIQFGDEYHNQSTLKTAIQILHKAVLDGTKEQKAVMLSLRHKIIVLNTMLKNDAIVGGEVKGMQIALPQTKFDKMMEIASLIPRIAFTVLMDLLLIPVALGVVIAECCKIDYNPKPEAVKIGKTPVLLLHGSGFNKGEFAVGMKCLDRPDIGSVFSINYDGIVSNDPTKGIDDYAMGKVREAIKRITELTGTNDIILMGHSMGGMVAVEYALEVAKKDGIKVNHVFSIASPWHGAPVLDAMWKVGLRSKDKTPKRHQQMSVSGGTSTDPDFRQKLVAKALESERKGECNFYSIFSSTDFAVPGRRGNLTENPTRQYSINYLGHYALVAWPSVWKQVTRWLSACYETESYANVPSTQGTAYLARA